MIEYYHCHKVCMSINLLNILCLDNLLANFISCLQNWYSTDIAEFVLNSCISSDKELYSEDCEVTFDYKLIEW